MRVSGGMAWSAVAHNEAACDAEMIRQTDMRVRENANFQMEMEIAKLQVENDNGKPRN